MQSLCVVFFNLELVYNFQECFGSMIHFRYRIFSFILFLGNKFCIDLHKESKTPNALSHNWQADLAQL